MFKEITDCLNRQSSEIFVRYLNRDGIFFYMVCWPGWNSLFTEFFGHFLGTVVKSAKIRPGIYLTFLSTNSSIIIQVPKCFFQTVHINFSVLPEIPHTNCFVLAEIPYKNCSVPAEISQKLYASLQFPVYTGVFQVFYYDQTSRFDLLQPFFLPPKSFYVEGPK